MKEKKRVLLAEDDPILGKVLVETFIEGGFDVTHVVNGLEVLEKIARCNPDVVVLDVLMSKLDGFDCLRELKNSSETKDTPVVMLTVLNDDESVKKGLDLGADEYVVKSQHSMEEVLEKVNKVLHV